MCMCLCGNALLYNSAIFISMAQNPEAGSSKQLLSPVKKHSRGKGFHTGEKNQIINIYKTLVNDNPQTTITNIVQKVLRLQE